jgi:serine---pyruvate transaminase
VPPQVLAALAEQVIHHRAPDFREVYARVLGRLKDIHRTSSEVLLFTCSGTGGFESAIVNLCSPGERVLAVSAGSFGERWIAMARTFGCDVEELRYAWGETPSAEELARKLAEIEPVSLVFLVHSETSTGVVADIQALAAVAKEAGALVVVDAVSSLGAVPLEMDDWGLDVVVSGSQKALMTPPGLATAAVSAAAWEQVARSTLPSFYFNWERTRKAQEAVDSAFTPAVSLIVALDVALGLLLDGGLDDAFERHVRLGRACRAGVKAMGLELFSPDEDRSAVVTAVRMPEGMDSAELARALRDRHGITIAGGQGDLKGAIFRIGHIGWYDEFDIATALSAVELVLGELGAPIERGQAATRALEVYAEGAAV